MNKLGGRVLHKPMGRREMVVRTAKAIAGGFAGASVLLGCNGEGGQATGKLRVPRGPDDNYKRDNSPILGKFLSPSKRLDMYRVLLPGFTNAAGRDIQLDEYIRKVSQGKPTILVFMTHYHSPDAPFCNTPLMVAEKIRMERPGIQVLGVRAYGVATRSQKVFNDITTELSLKYPQVLMNREAYDRMEEGVGYSNPLAMIVDGEQKAVFCTGYYENENGKGERDLLRVVDMVREGRLPAAARETAEEKREPVERKPVREKPEPVSKARKERVEVREPEPEPARERYAEPQREGRKGKKRRKKEQESRPKKKKESGKVEDCPF